MFVGASQRMDTSRDLSVGVPSPMEAAGEKTELDAKPPLGAPLLILHRGDQLKSFPLEDTSARQRGLKSLFSLSLVS